MKRTSSWLSYAMSTDATWQIPDSALAVLQDQPHDSVHHLESIGDHTNLIMKNLSLIDYDALFGELPQPMRYVIKNIMMYVGLLHDIGKPSSREEGYAKICQNCGKYNTTDICKYCGGTAMNVVQNTRYISHDSKGAELAGQFLQHVPEQYRGIIISLVKRHMDVGKAIFDSVFDGHIDSKRLARLIRKADMGDSGIGLETYTKMAVLFSIIDSISRISSASNPSEEMNNLINSLGMHGFPEIPQVNSLDEFPTELVASITPHIVENVSGAISNRMHLMDSGGNPQEDTSVSELGGEGVEQQIAQVLQEEGIQFNVSGNTGKSELFSYLASIGRQDVISKILPLFAG